MTSTQPRSYFTILLLFAFVSFTVVQCNLQTHNEILKLMQDRKNANLGRPTWSNFGRQIGNHHNHHFLKGSLDYFEEVNTIDQSGSHLRLITSPYHDTFLPDFHNEIEDVLIFASGIAVRGRVASLIHYLREDVVITSLLHKKISLHPFENEEEPIYRKISTFYTLTDDILFVQTSNEKFDFHELFGIKFDLSLKASTDQEKIEDHLSHKKLMTRDIGVSGITDTQQTLVEVNYNRTAISNLNQTFIAEDYGNLTIQGYYSAGVSLYISFDSEATAINKFQVGVNFVNGVSGVKFNFTSLEQVNTRIFEEFAFPQRLPSLILGPVGVVFSATFDLFIKGQVNFGGDIITISKEFKSTFEGNVIYDGITNTIVSHSISNYNFTDSDLQINVAPPSASYYTMGMGPRVRLGISPNVARASISLLPYLTDAFEGTERCGQSFPLSHELEYGMDLIATADIVSEEGVSKIIPLFERQLEYAKFSGCLQKAASPLSKVPTFPTIPADGESVNAPPEIIDDGGIVVEPETLLTIRDESLTEYFAQIDIDGTTVDCALCRFSVSLAQCTAQNVAQCSVARNLTFTATGNSVRLNGEISNSYNSSTPITHFLTRVFIIESGQFVEYSRKWILKTDCVGDCSFTLPLNITRDGIAYAFDIPIALTYEISATLFDRTFFQNQNSGKALFFFDSSLLTAYASSKTISHLIVQIDAYGFGTSTKIGTERSQNIFFPDTYDTFQRITTYKFSIASLLLETKKKNLYITVEGFTGISVRLYLQTSQQSVGLEIPFDVPLPSSAIIKTVFRGSIGGNYAFECNADSPDFILFFMQDTLAADVFDDFSTHKAGEVDVAKTTGSSFSLVIQVNSRANEFNFFMAPITSIAIGKYYILNAPSVISVLYYRFPINALSNDYFIDTLNSPSTILFAMLDLNTQNLPKNFTAPGEYSGQSELELDLITNEIISEQMYMTFIGDHLPTHYIIYSYVTLLNNIQYDYFIGKSAVAQQHFVYTLSPAFLGNENSIIKITVFGENISNLTMVYQDDFFSVIDAIPFRNANQSISLTLSNIQNLKAGDDFAFYLSTTKFTEVRYYTILLQEILQIQPERNYFGLVTPYQSIIYQIQDTSFNAGVNVTLTSYNEDCDLSVMNTVDQTQFSSISVGDDYVGVFGTPSTTYSIEVFGLGEFYLRADPLNIGFVTIFSRYNSFTDLRSNRFELILQLSPPYFFNIDYFASQANIEEFIESFTASSPVWEDSIVPAILDSPRSISFNQFYFNISVPAIDVTSEVDVCLYIIAPPQSIIPHYPLISKENFVILASRTGPRPAQGLCTALPSPSSLNTTPTKSPSFSRSPSQAPSTTRTASQTPTASKTPSRTPSPSGFFEEPDNSFASTIAHSFLLFVLLFVIFL